MNENLNLIAILVHNHKTVHLTYHSILTKTCR